MNEYNSAKQYSPYDTSNCSVRSLDSVANSVNHLKMVTDYGNANEVFLFIIRMECVHKVRLTP